MRKLLSITNILIFTVLIAFGCKDKTSHTISKGEQIHTISEISKETSESDVEATFSPAIGYRAVHRMNIKDVKYEAEFVKIAGVFNKLMAELGIPNTKYNFWKLAEGYEGEYRYVFESNWPDKETYDKVHEYEEFKRTFDKWYPIFKSMITEEVYSRNVLLK